MGPVPQLLPSGESEEGEQATSTKFSLSVGEGLMSLKPPSTPHLPTLTILRRGRVVNVHDFLSDSKNEVSFLLQAFHHLKGTPRMPQSEEIRMRPPRAEN